MSTFTVKTPGDLATAIKAVLPHASTDKTLPALCAVRFRVLGDTLILDATDRYTLGQSRVDVADIDGESTFILSTESVKSVLKLAGTPRIPLVCFMVVDGWVTVVNDETSIRVRTEDVQFPDVDRLIVSARDNIDSARESVVQSFTAKNLAKFDKCGDKYAVVTFWPAGGNKITLVTVGTDFVGLIMPNRFEAPERPALLVNA